MKKFISRFWNHTKMGMVYCEYGKSYFSVFIFYLFLYLFFMAVLVANDPSAYTIDTAAAEVVTSPILYIPFLYETIAWFFVSSDKLFINEKNKLLDEKIAYYKKQKCSLNCRGSEK